MSAEQTNSEATRRDARETLRNRAEALARKPEQERVRGEYVDTVAFLLADERYAIEVAYVREVLRLKGLVPLPCTPAFVVGIINVRGQILSVIDLKKLFGLPDTGRTDRNNVIIAHSAEMEFGILAEAILGIRSVALGEMQPPPRTLAGPGANYAKGVTKDRTAVLDAAAILSERQIVVEEVKA